MYGFMLFRGEIIEPSKLLDKNDVLQLKRCIYAAQVMFQLYSLKTIFKLLLMKILYFPATLKLATTTATSSYPQCS